MANYQPSYMNKYYKPGDYTFITKGQIEKGMVLEIDYTKQHAKQGEKPGGVYFILVLDVNYIGGTSGWAVHALNLKEIKPAIFDQIIKKLNAPIVVDNFRGRNFARLSYVQSPRLQYISELKTFIRTTAKNSYRTFDYYKGVKTVKLYNFNFYPNAK